MSDPGSRQTHARQAANLFDLQQKYADVLGLDDCLAYLEQPWDRSVP